jgi:hypothetical protein
MYRLVRLYLALGCLVLSACSAGPAPLTLGRSGVQKMLRACTQMAASSGIEISYTHDQVLPSELAVSINDGTISADTCDLRQQVSPVAIQRQNSGMSVVVIVSLDMSKSLQDVYFSSHSEPPIKNDINYKIYGRNSCAEPLQPLQLIADRHVAEIPWQPLYPNGPDCGVDGYLALVSDP